MSGNSRASYSSLRQCSLRCATATVMTHRVLSCAFQAVRHCQPARIANGRTLRMSYVAPSKWEYALMQVCRWLAISLRSVQGELLRRCVLVAMPPGTRSRMPDKVAVSSCGSCTSVASLESTTIPSCFPLSLRYSNFRTRKTFAWSTRSVHCNLTYPHSVASFTASPRTLMPIRVYSYNHILNRPGESHAQTSDAWTALLVHPYLKPSDRQSACSEVLLMIFSVESA